MKYKLINNQTKEEHLCDKVTIDGFDYYLSDENEITKDFQYVVRITTNRIYKVRIVDTLLGSEFIIIATNNPNIDIPKVVDLKLLKYKIAEFEYPTGKKERKHTEQEAFINGWKQCLQSQETHPFSEEDMIEFVNWLTKEDSPYAVMYGNQSERFATDNEDFTIKELLQIWKEQHFKIVYYVD